MTMYQTEYGTLTEWEFHILNKRGEKRLLRLLKRKQLKSGNNE